MAAPSAQTLQRIADDTGHQLRALEKMLRLLDLLQEIARDPVLSERLVLKGGAALNVFLSRDGLQGVVAHEMSHIINWDIRYMTAVGILVGMIALLSDAIARARWHRIGASSGDRRGKGGGGAMIIVFVIVLIFAILAPIAGRLAQFAVWRQREYLADATSVQLTRNPLGPIGALRKLGHQLHVRELGNRATQHLFIVNPIREFSATASALMATHPDVESRIERLRNLNRV